MTAPDWTSRAEARFADYVRRTETGERIDLREWIERQEARLRPRLRALAEAHREFDEQLQRDLERGQR